MDNSLMQSNILNGKVVIIIGGAGLLGSAFCKGLLQHGAIVILADIDIEKCHAVCSDINYADAKDSLFPDVVDITDKQSINSLINRVNEKFGKIDAVINNAYPRNKNYGRKLEFVEYNDFCENLNINLGGYFLSTQQFAKFFVNQCYGHVINISSIYGVVPPRFDIYNGTSMTMPVEYAAIKAAIQHLSIYFMRYYKGTPLRFNCLSPGGVKDNQPSEFLKAYSNYSQFKGMLEPEDLVGTIVFLVSDLSSSINGQNIVVDDGWSR